MRPAHRWIILYDIRDSKRLTRVAKYLSSVATRVQKSVFEMYGSNSLINKIKHNVAIRLEAEDSVAYIPLCVEDWEKTARLGVAGKDYVDPAEDDTLFL